MLFLNKKMDAVIAYVNGMEPTWRYQYILNADTQLLMKRFYDYGTLKYVLRGIDNYMKFFRKVFLIVSSIEQVPDYIDTNKIHIITHDKFIPHEFLPTFNANTIETFLWNIPNLDEEFVYFNDDMIPFNEMSETDFFKDGLPCINFREYQTLSFEFDRILQTSNDLSSFACGQEKKDFLWPHHIMIPYKKTFYKEAFFQLDDTIKSLITNTRRGNQVGQFYFSNWVYYNGFYHDHKIDYCYFHTQINDYEFIETIKQNENTKIMVINDYGCFNNKTILETKYIINEELNKKFNTKSIYEK
jgi:hypothetical protein